jgi:hypothetical protein
MIVSIVNLTVAAGVAAIPMVFLLAAEGNSGGMSGSKWLSHLFLPALTAISLSVWFFSKSYYKLALLAPWTFLPLVFAFGNLRIYLLH